MEITLTWQSIIAAGAVASALGAIIAAVFKFVRWIDHQKEQDKERADLKAKHDADIAVLKAEQEKQIQHIQNELTVICYGLRGALQGLIEKGCNGPCKDALNKLDKHLNQAAHDETGM